MSTREALTNFVLGFVAAGLGSFMVYPLDAVCWAGMVRACRTFVC
jgi:hypothetical protein